MKRLIICCDGTWQSLDNDWPTNVQRIAQFVRPTAADGTIQTLYYDPGLGLKSALDRVMGGAFGKGLDAEIEQAYSFLSMNWEVEDEIYLFGFSRGAYTVRSLAGLIRSCGIVRRDRLRAIPRAMALYRDREIGPDDDECIVFRKSNSTNQEETPPVVHFLGCFDTVGALGIPNVIPMISVEQVLNDDHSFHDTQLNSWILHARHAVAIDEQRQDFDVTRMQPPRHPKQGHSLKEIWFPGGHGNVGGGIRTERGLSDGALKWMVAEASSVGLDCSADLIEDYTRPDPLASFEPYSGALSLVRPMHHRKGPASKDALSDEAMIRWHKTGYCPPPIEHLLKDGS
jgi:uncharacterized protein (DUF2235 family)